MEDPVEVLDTTSSNEEGLEETLIDTEDVEALRHQLAEANKKLENFDQVVARAKKAEALLKNKPEATQNITTSGLSKEDIEEAILKNTGMSADLLKDLKALAKVRNTGLIEAQNDPIFVAIKKAQEEEAKSEKAKLPASRGSSSVKKEKDFNTPSISDAEHKELWKASMGR